MTVNSRPPLTAQPAEPTRGAAPERESSPEVVTASSPGTDQGAGGRGTRPRPASAGLFRAFWRWHFYASFLVIPVLLVLATTGLIYLFRFQIEPLLHADLMKVDVPRDVVSQPYAAQARAVETAYPDATVVSMTEPAEAGRSTVFSVTLPDGSPRDVYVNPYGAEVLGSLNPDDTLSGIAVRLHGELMAGPKGDYLIELGACWAIVMAATGYYLFFRGRAARARRRASNAAGAALRSRHAAVGSVRRCGPAAAARVRAALDRLLGLEGAGARDGERVIAVEHRPRRHLRPHVEARRVAAAQPRTRSPVGPREHRRPRLRHGSRREVGSERRHGGPGRGRARATAPDDGRAARRRRGGLLGDRVRLRRPDRRAHRARRPVRRRCCRHLRLRRLPAPGEGGVPGHRPARRAQSGAGELLGHGVVLRSR